MVITFVVCLTSILSEPLKLQLLKVLVKRTRRQSFIQMYTSTGKGYSPVPDYQRSISSVRRKIRFPVVIYCSVNDILFEVRLVPKNKMYPIHCQIGNIPLYTYPT